jgi:hypothetical protein
MTVTDDRMFFGTLVYSDGRENLREGDHDIGWCLYPYGQIWWLVTCPGIPSAGRLHVNEVLYDCSGNHTEHGAEETG